MTLLPGFKKGSTSVTLPEIVQDQSFSESMKQLNHDSDRYQWDILGFKFQRAEPTTIQTIYSGLEISITAQPYWALEMDGDQQEISQEFNINSQDGFIKYPSQHIPISLHGLKKHGLYSPVIKEELGDGLVFEYNTTKYSTYLDSIIQTKPEVDLNTYITSGGVLLKSDQEQSFMHPRNIFFNTENISIPPASILLTIDELDTSEVILSDESNIQYTLIQTFLIARGFSPSWNYNTNSVFQVVGFKNTYYELLSIEVPTGAAIVKNTIWIPRTVKSIKVVEENGFIKLMNSKLNVSDCPYLSSIPNIDESSTGSSIVLTTKQIQDFASRITEGTGGTLLFDGVLDVEEVQTS